MSKHQDTRETLKSVHGDEYDLLFDKPRLELVSQAALTSVLLWRARVP